MLKAISSGMVGASVGAASGRRGSGLLGPATVAAEAFNAAVLAQGVDLKSLGVYPHIRKFILDCMLCGAWDLIYAAYPLVGNTAGAHSINLKTPGTRSISWTGAVDHYGPGILGDGATASGHCNFTTADLGSNGNTFAIGGYVHTLTIAGASRSLFRSFMTASQGVGLRHNSSVFYMHLCNNINEFTATVGQSMAWAKGDLDRSYYNASKVKTDSSVSFTTTPTTLPFRLLTNPTASGEFASSRVTFAWVGKGFTDTIASGLFDAIQTFQVGLGRAV